MGVVSGGAFYGRMIAGGSYFSQRGGHMGWSIEGWLQGVVNRGMVIWGGQ